MTEQITVSSSDLDFSPVVPGEFSPTGPYGYTTGPTAAGSSGNAPPSASTGTSKTGGTSNIGLNPFGYSLPVPVLPDWLKPYTDLLIIAAAVAVALLLLSQQKRGSRT